jgi:putative ABC transport system permease protein
VPLLLAGLCAVSLGLAGGLWAVVDAVALRPLPYPNAHELVAVMERHPERGLMSVTAANFWDWSPRVVAFQSVVGLGLLESSLVARGAATRIVGTRVTEPFFDVVGIVPALGRRFTAEDFGGARRVAVLSDSVWTRTFGRAPDAIGATVLLDGEEHTVVGVMPRTFKPLGPSDVWVPWVMSPEERRERRFHMVGVLARLRPGGTAVEAERELRAAYRALSLAHPDTTDRWTGVVTPLRDLLIGDARRSLALLGVSVLVLLVVTGLNVAGLLTAWLRQRRQELVVRLALGATVGRLVRQLVIEALAWGTAGVVTGLWLAAGFVELFGALGLSPALEYDFEARVDGRVVVAMAVGMCLLAIITTAVPAWVGAMRATDLAARRAARSGRWSERAAIAGQVAASLALVCVAAVLLSGYRRAVLAAGPSTDAIVAAHVSLADTRYDEPAQGRFFEHLLQALAARPEIARAGAASYVPPGRIYGNVRFAVEGGAGATDAQTTLVSAIDPHALQMLGVGLERGRIIDQRDDAAAPHVALISATLARRYWPGRDPLGHRITLAGTDRPLTIVGVVEDVRQPLSGDPRAETVLYLSYRQVPWPFMTMLIEPTSDVAAAVVALREEITRLDPTQAAGAARPLDQVRHEWIQQPRLRARLVAIFGGSVLVLTLAGLWARVSYDVASRRRELAIRLALGARSSNVVRAVAIEGVLVVGVGAAAGLALLPLALSLARRVVAALPGSDLPVLAPAAAIVVALALASGWWPARAAGRVSPAEALRVE